MMIEVFKTNVSHPEQAEMLLGRIHSHFADHKASFDLEDCDRILRVKSTSGNIRISGLIDLMIQSGFYAEVLDD